MIEHDWFCRSIYQRSDNVFSKFLKCILCAVSRHQSCHHDLNVKSTLKVFRKIKKQRGGAWCGSQWDWYSRTGGEKKADPKKEAPGWLGEEAGEKGLGKIFIELAELAQRRPRNSNLLFFFSSLPSCVSLFCWRPDFDSAFSFASACTKQVVCWQRQTNKTR